MWRCLLGPYAFMCSQLGHYWREEKKQESACFKTRDILDSLPSPLRKKIKLSLTDSKNAFSQICSQFLQRALCLFSGRNPRQLKTRRHLRRMRLLSRVDPAPSRAFPAWTLKLFCLQTRPSSTQHIHWQTLTLTPGHLIVSTPGRWWCLRGAWSMLLPWVLAFLHTEQAVSIWSSKVAKRNLPPFWFRQHLYFQSWSVKTRWPAIWPQKADWLHKLHSLS